MVDGTQKKIAKKSPGDTIHENDAVGDEIVLASYAHNKQQRGNNKGCYHHP